MRNLIALCLLLGATPVAAADFVVEPGEPNQVIFFSKAPMESFEGKTDRISGTLTVDPARLSGKVTCTFQVDMASLETGIGLRDRHMRDNHLDTKEFPEATFEGGTLEEVSASALAVGVPVTLDLVGEFTLHGVTREITVATEATLNEEGGIEVVGRFTVNLKDYDIKRPGFLMMKLSEDQDVEVRFTAVPETD